MIEHIDNYNKWSKSRQHGIGGSDAACVVGLNPYKSNVDLWKEKTGLADPEDISDKPYVKFGKEAEKHIRGLFELHNLNYSIDYSEFDIHRNDVDPYIFATLDGIIHDNKSSKVGVLECKTTQIRKSADWKLWEEQLPQHYYVQLLHQLIATSFDFAQLCVLIKYGNRYQLRTSEYIISADDETVQNDMKYLKEKERLFWQAVKERKEPPLILPNIL